MNQRDLEKAALRGEPSYVWRAGQERRLRMIHEAAGDLVHGKVLDVGCGVGMYLSHLAQTASQAVGVEYDLPRALQAKKTHSEVVHALGERLPFPEDTFDLVLSHEVLEHVEDDRAAVGQIVRVLRRPDPGRGIPAGRLVLFVPSRGYPFETHGIYLRGRYRFGNFPLVNYLPRKLRDRLAPHVRVYASSDLDRLLRGLPVRIVHKTIIFGGYDNIIARWPRIGRTLRAILHTLEHTPLRAFGLSHFWVAERL